MSTTPSELIRRHRVRIVSWILMAAAIIVLVSGALPLARFGDLAVTTGPVLIFVLAMTIVAELASVAGVFSIVAERLAVWGRGRRALLWVFVLVMITVSTAFMSLDTTAVLITPVVVVLARHIGVSPLPFALATVWLANTASLFLPVSNLTNLLAAGALGGTPLGFLAEFWAPALVAVIVTVVALTLIHRRSLSGRYELAETTVIPDRRLLIIAAVVVAVLLPMLVSGVPVALVASAAALILLVVFAVRRRSVLTLRLVPWGTIAIAASLFVIVEAIHVQGHDVMLGAAVGEDDGVIDLLRIASIGAVGANVVNNLPAYLSLSAFADTPLRLRALLIGGRDLLAEVRDARIRTGARARAGDDAGTVAGIGAGVTAVWSGDWVLVGRRWAIWRDGGRGLAGWRGGGKETVLFVVKPLLTRRRLGVPALRGRR